MPGVNKLEKIEFEDCNFAARIGQYSIGDTVLVVRSGAILPRDLAKQLGALRLVKKYKVQLLNLAGIVSDCAIFPLIALEKDCEIRKSPHIYLGFEIADKLGIARSADFNREPKKKITWFNRLRKNLTW